MPQQKNFAQTYLFSGVGIIAIAILLIGLNAMVDVVNIRKDCTRNNLYTLSQGTKEILKQIKDPVRIEFYSSENVEGMPAEFKNYAREVENLLHEYEEAAPGGSLEIRKYTPKPLSDAADAAEKLGITPQTLSRGDKIYFGLAVTQFDKAEAIPFLNPDQRNRLEYEITRKIDQIIHPEQAGVGIISSLPIMGQNRARMPMRQQQSDQGPWWIVQQLRKQYDVKKLEADGLTEIPDDIDVLLIVHPPSNLSAEAKFAIDQYVMRGGKLMAFVDPMCMSAQQQQNPMNPQPQQGGAQQSSDLQPLLDQWGVSYESEKVIADLVYQSRVGGGREQATRDMPTILSLDENAMNADDPATSPINSIIAPFPGALEGTAPSGIERTVLMHSSAQSQLINKFQARMGGQSVKENFNPSHKEYPLAISLHGTFETAYPDGAPPTDTDEEEEDGKQQKPDTDSQEEEQADKADDYLKKSQEPGTVVIVADADMLNDQFCIRKQNFFGQEVSSPISDNLSFVQNKVEQLSGSTSLAQIRSRGAERRPFVVINRMRAEAQEKYQDRINALEEELSNIRRKLQNLQDAKSGEQRFILSPEQTEAMERFQEKKVETRKKLKELRKQLKEEIDSLKAGIEWMNMGGIPFLVGLTGIIIALIRRRREQIK